MHIRIIYTQDQIKRYHEYGLKLDELLTFKQIIYHRCLSRLFDTIKPNYLHFAEYYFHNPGYKYLNNINHILTV